MQDQIKQDRQRTGALKGTIPRIYIGLGPARLRGESLLITRRIQQRIQKGHLMSRDKQVSGKGYLKHALTVFLKT